MKLGIITDIHEHVEHLRTALAHFQAERVDQVVIIGDVCELGNRLGESCTLLSQANVVGVWGNHDYGQCVEPSDELRREYGDNVIDFMTSLQPRLVVADCHFSHVEPWLDPNDVADLWYFGGPPDETAKLERIFNAIPNRMIFMGHYHQWLLATPNGISDWNGDTPMRLADGRFFVVVGALCKGRYAMLDTDSWEMLPFNEQPL